MYRAIFIDIDGTLRDNNKNISQRTINVIEKLVRNGILVVISSGGPRKYTENVSKESKASNSIISSNGASIYDYGDKKIIYENIMDKQACIELYKVAKNAGVNFAMNVGDDRIEIKANDDISQILGTDIENFIYKNNIVQCIILDEDYNKIKGLYTDIKKVKNVEIINRHISLIDDNASKIGNIYYDIASKNTNKGNGILEFCKVLNINIKDTIAIGNDFNDVPMFNVVGYSVAMQNSDDEVKKYADEITKSNEDDGVAIFLEKLLSNLQ